MQSSSSQLEHDDTCLSLQVTIVVVVVVGTGSLHLLPIQPGSHTQWTS